MWMLFFCPFFPCVDECLHFFLSLFFFLSFLFLFFFIFIFFLFCFLFLFIFPVSFAFSFFLVQMECVRLLLEHGADVTAGAAVVAALRAGCEAAANVFLERGARLDDGTLDSEGYTPLLAAASSARSDAMVRW